MRDQAFMSERDINRRCRRIWNDAVRGCCLMKGIKTLKGRSPTYCGPRPDPRASNNHTIADNIIRTGDRDGAGTVVTFAPTTEIANWSPRFFEDMVHPDTPIGIATVGRYACLWHDELFNVIDLIGNYRDSEQVATLLALRATLMPRYLAQRNRLYFSRRAAEIPNEITEGKMS